MSQISLGLQLDPENKVHMEAAAVFFSKMAGVESSTTEKPKTEETEKKEKPKKMTPGKKSAPKEEAPKEEAPKEEAPKEEAPKEEAPKEEAPKEEAADTNSEESAVNEKELRELLAKVVKESMDNRTSAKKKLTELGANNISALAKDKHQELFDFLKGLENG